MDIPWRDLNDEEKRFIVEGDGKGLRRHPRVLPLARAQEIQGSRPRVPQPVSRLSDVSRLRRRTPAPRGARRQGRRPHDRSGVVRHRPRGRSSSSSALELTEKEAAIGDKVLKEIHKRLKFLSDVGLDYLTLDRLSSTLSGGESQRINLATSLGIVAGRHALRARRAVDRPALARQPAAHQHPAAAPRSGQHGARRRARRRHDSRRRHDHRPRARRGRAGGACRVFGLAREPAAGSAIVDGEVSARRSGDSRARRRGAGAAGRSCGCSGRPSTT